MASMRLILTEEVPKLGDAGEVVTVRAGFGRNYLLPQGKAMLATESRVRELDTEANAKELGEKAMIINNLNDWSTFVRKLATLEREHGERGRFRPGSA